MNNSAQPPLISHPGKTLHGSISVPGDKSISHRAALMAAMAEGTSRLEGFLEAGVTQAMIDCLAPLGAVFTKTTDNGRAILIVEGRGGSGWKAPVNALNCGNSATTIRMLAGALASQPAWLSEPSPQIILDGSEQLRRRPMKRITGPLSAMGADIQTPLAPDCAPLHIQPTRLNSAHLKMAVASAQVKSCILLAGLYASGPVTVEEPLPSRDHTERMLRGMGVKVTEKDGLITLAPVDRPLPPLYMRIPGDFSSAAFLIAAAAMLPGSEIRIREVGLNPGRTGLLDILVEMGAGITIENEHDVCGEPAGDIVVKGSGLKAGKVQGELVVRMIDEFPIFAALACFAEGDTVVREAEELRVKESDRIAVVCSELRRLGANIDEAPDGFTVHGPCRMSGAAVDAHGDHRLAMSLAVAGLRASGETIVHGAAAVKESFPEFPTILKNLGAEVQND